MPIVFRVTIGELPFAVRLLNAQSLSLSLGVVWRWKRSRIKPEVLELSPRETERPGASVSLTLDYRGLRILRKLKGCSIPDTNPSCRGGIQKLLIFFSFPASLSTCDPSPCAWATMGAARAGGFET